MAHYLPRNRISISSSVFYHSVSPSAFPKHLSQVRDYRLRLLPGRKMASSVMLLLENHLSNGPGPSTWQHVDVLWEMADAEVDIWYPSL